jgi:tetratricopeptide (TPR) repeat protein
MPGWRKSLVLAALLFMQSPVYAGGWLENDRALLQKGKNLYQAGQFDEALRPFADAIGANPNSAEAYYWRALCLDALKQPDGALHDFSTAIGLSNSVPAFYIGRGLLYSNQNKLDLAIADFDSVLKIDPYNQEAKTNRDFCVKEVAHQQQIAQKQAEEKAKAEQDKANADKLAAANPVAPTTIVNASTSIHGSKPEDRAYEAALLKQRREAEKQAKIEKDAREKLALQKNAQEQSLTAKFEHERQERERIERELAEARKQNKTRKTQVATTPSVAPTASQVAAAVTSVALTAPVKTAGAADSDAAGGANVNRPVRDKWALIIGISKFENHDLDLHYPSKDAKDFYKFLTTKGNFSKDHVKLLVNEDATRANILSLLGDKWLPRVANPDDLVVIYISSHGSSSDMDVSGVNYLLAYDSDPDNLYSSGLPMQDMTRMIKGRVHADRVVMILDACHSGAVSADAKGLSRGGNVNADEIAMGTGQLVISSSAPNQVSWESKQDENSVFTKYLMDGLAKKGDKTTLEDAFQYMKDRVQEEVLRERGVLQTPVLKSSWKGNDLVIGAQPISPRPGLVVNIPAASNSKMADSDSRVDVTASKGAKPPATDAKTASSTKPIGKDAKTPGAGAAKSAATSAPKSATTGSKPSAKDAKSAAAGASARDTKVISPERK